MDLVVFAMLGGSMGWGVSRMMCTADGRRALTINTLTGISGAVIAGWFLIPLPGGGAQNDFTVAAPVVSLGAVVALALVVFLRLRRDDEHVRQEMTALRDEMEKHNHRAGLKMVGEMLPNEGNRMTPADEKDGTFPICGSATGRSDGVNPSLTTSIAMRTADRSRMLAAHG